MVRDWDDDLDDLDRVAGMFDKDPHTVFVTVWIVDDESDAEIVTDLLDENNIVAMIVAACEAGEYAAFGPPDSIHVQVSRADSDVAVQILQDEDDLPGSGIVFDEDVAYDNDSDEEDDDTDDDTDDVDDIGDMDDMDDEY